MNERIPVVLKLAECLPRVMREVHLELVAKEVQQPHGAAVSLRLRGSWPFGAKESITEEAEIALEREGDENCRGGNNRPLIRRVSLGGLEEAAGVVPKIAVRHVLGRYVSAPRSAAHRRVLRVGASRPQESLGSPRREILQRAAFREDLDSLVSQHQHPPCFQFTKRRMRIMKSAISRTANVVQKVFSPHR